MARRLAHNAFGHLVLCILFPSLLLMLASCAVGSPSQHQTLSSDPVVRWIQQNASPLRTVAPGGSDTDLAPLQQMVGHASIVGLGEETHGTHEFIEVKARLAEYLITHLGFTTFVMENDWGASQEIDAYINGGSGSLTSVMHADLLVPWQTKEYAALFAWMRTYNANAAHTTKIHFWGMDIQDVSQSEFTTVERFVQQVASQQSSVIQSLYAPIIAKMLPNAYATYVPLDAATKQQDQTQAQQVYDLLQTHQQSYTQTSSPQQFAFALQMARIIVQCVTYFNTLAGIAPQQSYQSYHQRDTFMAENVEWIHDHVAGVAPKMIVWAHDGHIANDANYGSRDGRNMGAELRATYQSGYLAIGTTTYQGAYRVYGAPSVMVKAIPQLTLSTYNYDLGQAGRPYYLLDLHKTPTSGAVADWVGGLSSANILPFYGVGGEDLSVSGILNQWFDALVHVQISTPSQPL